MIFLASLYILFNSYVILCEKFVFKIEILLNYPIWFVANGKSFRENGFKKVFMDGIDLS